MAERRSNNLSGIKVGMCCDRILAGRKNLYADRVVPGTAKQVAEKVGTVPFHSFWDYDPGGAGGVVSELPFGPGGGSVAAGCERCGGSG